MHAAIPKKREELAELCRQYDVARLKVFGSAARVRFSIRESAMPIFSSSSIPPASYVCSTGISVS